MGDRASGSDGQQAEVRNEIPFAPPSIDSSIRAPADLPARRELDPARVRAAGGTGWRGTPGPWNDTFNTPLSAAVEPDQAQGVEAGFQGYRARFLDRAVEPVVVHHQRLDDFKTESVALSGAQAFHAQALADPAARFIRQQGNR